MKKLRNMLQMNTFDNENCEYVRNGIVDYSAKAVYTYKTGTNSTRKLKFSACVQIIGLDYGI